MLNSLLVTILAQTTSSSSSDGGAGSLFALCCGAIFGILYIACLWVVFQKAGKPGWAAIIPIYNYFILMEIVGRPVWWIILLFVPGVNFFILLIVFIDLARSFGKGDAYGCLLFVFPYVFLPLMAFDGSTYKGPAALNN